MNRYLSPSCCLPVASCRFPAAFLPLACRLPVATLSSSCRHPVAFLLLPAVFHCRLPRVARIYWLTTYSDTGALCFPLWAWLWVWWGGFKTTSASAPLGSLQGRYSDKKTKIQRSGRHKSMTSQSFGPHESRVTEFQHSRRQEHQISQKSEISNTTCRCTLLTHPPSATPSTPSKP